MLCHLPSGIETGDPFSGFLLAISAIGQADRLVTEDYRAGLLRHCYIGPTPILTPGAFCAELL